MRVSDEVRARAEEIISWKKALERDYLSCINDKEIYLLTHYVNELEPFATVFEEDTYE